MKDAMQNPIFWDEKCNAPAQTAGSRSSGSHQSCRSGYFRTDFQLPSDSNCQFASRYTNPSDFSFIPTDPADAATACARVTVPATIGSAEVGSSTRSSISSVSGSVANKPGERRVHILQALLDELLCFSLRRQSPIPRMNSARLPFDFEPVAHPLERQPVVAHARPPIYFERANHLAPKSLLREISRKPFQCPYHYRVLSSVSSGRPRVGG